jgi:hypothetical protein
MNELKTNVCEVTFTKVNGEQRVMKCTLLESYITPVERVYTANTKVRAKNDEVLSVWSIDDNSWRSFRKDSVISYRVLE